MPISRPHSAHGSGALTKRIVHRDQLASRRHGERVDDIDRACRIWLLEHDPSYALECENYRRRHGLKFGRKG